MAAHALDCFAGNGKADASAVVSGVGINALKEAKDAVLIPGGDADAVVLDPDADVAVKGFCENFDNGGNARSGELHGVAQEVGKALGEPGLVAQNGGQPLRHVNG